MTHKPDDDFVRRSNELAHDIADALLNTLYERVSSVVDPKLGACATTMAVGHIQAFVIKIAVECGLPYEAAMEHVARNFHGTLANLNKADEAERAP